MSEPMIRIEETYPNEKTPRVRDVPSSAWHQAQDTAREQAIEFLSLYGKAAVGAVVRVRVLALCLVCDGTCERDHVRVERNGYGVVRAYVCSGASHEPRVMEDEIFRIEPKL